MDLLVYLKFTSADIPWTVQDLLKSRTSDFLLAPALLRIYFTWHSKVSEAQEIIHYRDQHPSDWCPLNIQGVLIRSYSNGTDSLVHFRGLETAPDAYHSDISIRPRNDCHHHDDWFDLAIFSTEKLVSEDILSQVYTLAEDSKDWEEPGRDLELPEGAWDVLRNSQDSMEQIEDGEEDDGTGTDSD